MGPLPPDSAPALCPHLEPFRQRLLRLGARQHAISQCWSAGNHFAFFDALIDRAALRAAIPTPDCVIDHDHLGTHSGAESGLTCTRCRDGLVGHHPLRAPSGTPTFG